jgi:hypothetical protein
MKICLTFLSLLFSTLMLPAQIDQATPGEKQALDKAIPIIVHTLDQFNSDDWEITQDFYSGDVLVNQKPDVPLDINQNFEREYRIKYNSERYNTLLKPLQDKIMEAVNQGDLNKAQALGKENKRFISFTVDVYINRRISNVNPNDKETVKLDVKGVDFCYHTGKDQYDNDISSYLLLFGNWKTAKYGEYGLHYHFIHPPKTPYIENIEIIIKGADDYIVQLLKTVNWSEMQNALSP